MLQWGHVFSDVETIEDMINQGADKQASMGPRLFRRGNIRSGDINVAPLNRFNGATSFQTWKPCHGHQNQYKECCFNGATSFQTWKRPLALKALERLAELQWGHVFSDVET